MQQKVSGPVEQRFVSDWKLTCGGAANITALSSLGIFSGLGAVSLAAAMGVCIYGGGRITIGSPIGVDVSAVPGAPGFPVVVMNPFLETMLQAIFNHTHEVPGAVTVRAVVRGAGR